MAVLRWMVCGLAILIGFLVLRMAAGADVAWKRNFPPVNYLKNSQAHTDPWRWRRPRSQLSIPYDADSRLGVHNAPEVSSFIFRQEFRFADFTAHLFGALLIGFDLVGLVSPSQQDTSAEFSFLFVLIRYLLPLSLGLFLLQVGDRAHRIDLYPDRLGIVTQYAFCLQRTTFYQRDQLVQVTGKCQSFLSMERGQTQPDYKIILGGLWFGTLQMNKTFKLRCNPTQGSWIVGGLNHWRSLPIRQAAGHSARHHSSTHHLPE